MNYNINGVPCDRGNRCKAYKICYECNRIRQARIADVAEIGAAISPRSTFAVVRSYSERTLNKDKAELVKRLKAVSKGGIWTIEKGEQVKGLHVNLIIGSDKAIDAKQIAKLFPSDSDVWSKEIPRADIRKVAAYAGKLSQIPQREDYSGNIYGSFGEWKRPLGLLGESKAVVLEVLAKEEMLVEAGYGDAIDFDENTYSETLSVQEMLEKAAPISKKVLNDEIEVQEVYLPERGIMSKEEALREFRAKSADLFD